MLNSQADDLAFLAEVHRQAEGSMHAIVDMWDAGDALCWDRDRTHVACERLISRRLLRAMCLGGGIAITAQGIEHVEAVNGSSYARESAVRSVLEAVYGEAEGSPGECLDLVQVAHTAGVPAGETSGLLGFMSTKGLIKWRAIGGIGSITDLGISMVESGTPPRHSPARQSPLPPHDDDRRYGILFADMVEHSKIVKVLPQAESDRLLGILRSRVELEVSHRKGVLMWQGDGGMALFPGASSQVRSVEAALGLVAMLLGLNAQVGAEGPEIRLRVAVHTGVFAMPQDPGDIHSASINLAAHLEKSAPPNTVIITSDVLEALPSELSARFRESDPAAGVRVHRYSPADQAPSPGPSSVV